MSRAAEIADQAAAHFSNGRGGLFIPTAGFNSMAVDNNVAFDYTSLDEAFPTVDPGHIAAGSLLLVQIRQPKTRVGSIEIPTELRKTELDNTQVAKVVGMGPLAFRSRNTYEPWPEGAWCSIGDFIRIPKYQGDRFAVAFERDDYVIAPGGDRRAVSVSDYAEFCFLKDLSMLARIPDPLRVRSFL